MLSITGTDLWTDRQTDRQTDAFNTAQPGVISKCKAQRKSGVFRCAAHGAVTMLLGSTVRSLADGQHQHQHQHLNLPNVNATVRHAACRPYRQNSTRCHDTRIKVISFTPNRSAGHVPWPCP